MNVLRVALWAAAVCAAAMRLNAQGTTGEELRLASAGPRFLSTPVSGAAPIDVTDAPVFQRHVTVDFDRVALKDALVEIGRQARLHIVLSDALVSLDHPVSISASHISTAAALTEILMGTGLDVQLSRDGTTASLVPRIRTAISSGLARHEQGTGTITGHVTDAAIRTPLSEVSVRIEGTTLGAVANADGKYLIAGIAPGTYRVTVRRVGYQPLSKDVAVGVDQSVMVDFALTAAPTKLDEIVTTAVGQQRRYEVGNTISTINADSIAPTAPITSLTDLISARAPGVTVEETGGLTGSGETIRIRGLSSLVLQGDPIVIIDGIRQDNTPGGAVPTTVPQLGIQGVAPAPTRLNDIDFSNIASIDVLKGPSASTEYGTDAANGVLVITTKHGVAGSPQWTASGEDATSNIPESFPTLYYRWGHTTDASRTPVQCPLDAYAFGSGYGSAEGTCAVDSVTAWNSLNNPYYSIFGTGSRQRYELSVGGGSEAARYFISGGLSNETGILRLPGVFAPEADALGLPQSEFKPNGEDQRAARANTAIKIGPTADLSVNAAYLSTFQQTPNAQLLYMGTTIAPPLHDSTHSYGYGYPGYDPVYQFGNPTSHAKDRVTGGVTANWRPTDWLVGHGTVGVDHGSERDESSILPQVVPLASYQPAQLGIEDATTDIYTVDLRGSATAVAFRTVRAVTSIGLQLVDTRIEGTTITATGVTATNLTVNGAVNPAVTQLGNRQATMGGYGEEELGVWDRLFVTGALRIDAGSGFGRDYTTALYPKASVSWLALPNEPTTVRVRAAFGESGVQPPNGAALQLYAPTIAWQGAGLASAVAIANAENPNLQPERSIEYEGGADLGLWHNRVSVELTGYTKMTHDALVSTGTGWEAGGYSYTENVGDVRNTGVEGAVTAEAVRGRSVTWDLSLNASLNHNALVSLAPGILAPQLTGQSSVFRFVPGSPLYGYWAPRVAYSDANHDGIIEPNEVTVADSLTYVGSSQPTREASLGTRVGLWNGTVSVNALFDYRGGYRLMNTTALWEAIYAQSDRASTNASSPLWEQARDVGAEVILTRGLDGYAAPAGFAEDATFVRFRELSLTYALPRDVVRAVHGQSVSLTGAVRNLALWTRYTGVDPEVSSVGGLNAEMSPTSNTYLVNNNIREDVGGVPLLRYWVARLNVAF